MHVLGSRYSLILIDIGVSNFQVMAVDLSYRLGWIDDSLVKRVHKILLQANLPTAAPETMTVDMFKSVMAVSENEDEDLSHIKLK